ncbi:TRAP transporter substrate-binding protein [Thauera butanivorans]|uniref:TRAP transporter substrate-binding protein n=1 Tax=Thauera butanivorans TaxID=86174 RepID=UPI003AB4320C
MSKFSHLRRTLIGGALSLALAPLSTLAVAAEPIVIKFSHVVAQDTPKGKGADKFKELAEKYTNGAVKVEVYPNSTLYKDKEEVEALQLGAVQMLAPSLSKFGPLGVREFEVFDLPYIFDSYEALHKVTKGPVGQQLLDKLEPRGIKGLAYWDNGFKALSANTPIRTPADLRGKKLRIQSSKVLEEQMREVRALPQVMAFSEVYQALQTGVVDGTENTLSNYFTQKVHEVQKHMTISDHGYIGYVVITNKRFWDGLPAEVRSQLDKAMDEATDYANQIAKEENDQMLEAVRASGRTEIHMLSDEERAAFIKALLPVHKKMESRVGAATIKSIYEATGFDPDKF